MNINKKFLHQTLYYIPALVVLGVSLFALNASIFDRRENNKLHVMYEQQVSQDGAAISQLQSLKAEIDEKETWLYWSVWALGLLGFALALANADQLRRLKEANNRQEDSLALLEKQLEDIQKAEKDKQALQEQLHQAQKLEAVGRLAGGIAHDFNNILASMNGYAEFLTDDLKEGGAQHGFAVNILKAGKQARELVDKMLAFSRRESDEIQNMSLAATIDEALSMLKVSLPKSVNVTANVEDKDYIVVGNPTSISQAIMNLCLNAKDAMPNEKGNLMVSLGLADMSYFETLEEQEDLPSTNDTPLINIADVSPVHTCLSMGKIARDQDYLCLSVADDGTGMTRVIMENIFEPFFTTKPVNEGTGLGLAMVHGVIASHQGAMQINSIAGKGTRFDLLFPTIGKVSLEDDDNIEFDTHEGMGFVLVVEDQEDVRDMIRTMLERQGFEVETCNDGQSAFEILTEHPNYFNAVVTDQNMPNLTGSELIEKISPQYPDIPFIMVSGYSIESIHEKMQEHPSVKAILKKPIDREKLREAIQGAIIERQFAA
jgi:signal transduction histidine kinase/CheY-like chemotaxis protein